MVNVNHNRINLKKKKKRLSPDMNNKCVLWHDLKRRPGDEVKKSQMQKFLAYTASTIQFKRIST